MSKALLSLAFSLVFASSFCSESKDDPLCDHLSESKESYREMQELCKGMCMITSTQRIIHDSYKKQREQLLAEIEKSPNTDEKLRLYAELDGMEKVTNAAWESTEEKFKEKKLKYFAAKKCATPYMERKGIPFHRNNSDFN